MNHNTASADKSVKVQSQGFEYGVKHFSAHKNAYLETLVCDALNLDSTLFLELLNLGAIYVNQKRTLDNILLDKDTPVRVHTKPRRYNQPVNWKERIVFENHDFLVLNKPSGYPSHPSVDNCLENALTQTEIILNHKLLITHRLDTLTEGLIVYGKTPLFVSEFNTLLQAHRITKKYCAVVQSEKDLPTTIIHYMEPSPRAPKHVLDFEKPQYLRCELQIEKQSPFEWNNYFHLKHISLNLLTGRTHQIRTQMGCLGGLNSPIIGDRLYGSKVPWTTPESIALRAYSLEFTVFGKTYTFQIDQYNS